MKFKCKKCGKESEAERLPFGLCRECFVELFTAEALLNPEGLEQKLKDEIREQLAQAILDKQGGVKVDYACPQCGSKAFAIADTKEFAESVLLKDKPLCPDCDEKNKHETAKGDQEQSFSM